MNLHLYCPRCGKAMTVAREHVRMLIGCPHCDHGFRPAAITRLPDTVADFTPIADLRSSPAPLNASLGPRSRVAAGLLGVFFGCLGLHRFYLGYTGVGLIQVCLTAGSFVVHPLICCTPLVALWGFVEGILCLAGRMTDAEGRPLTQ